MAKSKVTFSARKDPLLRPRRAASEPSKTASLSLAKQLAEPADSAPPTKSSTTRGRTTTARKQSVGPHAVEEPAGVIAVPPAQKVLARADNGLPDGGASASEVAAPSQRAERSRVARRIQTSISLPPQLWDTLEELGAGVSAGELLTAILSSAMPESVEAAASTLEQLLVDMAPNEGLHEERNYRLPLELRTQLDSLTKRLGSLPRMQRSILIRAILTAHMPGNGEQARELLTARRIHAMRAAMASGQD